MLDGKSHSGSRRSINTVEIGREESVSIRGDPRVLAIENWERVVWRNGNPYCFPERISYPEWNLGRYQKACVSRWSVYKSHLDDLKIVYFGETDNLPQWVERFRNQNDNIGRYLRDRLTEGCKVSLEVLVTAGKEGVLLERVALEDRDTRRELKKALIEYYSRSGWTVLNH